MTNGRNAVVYVSDFKDALFFETSLRSLRFFDPAIDVFVLTDKKLITENASKTLGRYDAKPIFVENLYYRHFRNIDSCKIHKWSKFVFYRLLIPFIPELRNYDNILYMDTDTIFVKDFTFLFKLDTARPFGMFYWKRHGRGKIRRNLETAYRYSVEKGAAPERFPDPYYNAGIILFNNAVLQTQIREWENKLHMFDGIFDP